MSKTIVVTGANRGIGLKLVQTLAAQGNKVIATARNPEAAKDLAAIPNLVGIVAADYGDLESLPRVAQDIEKLAPEGVDELWNNAGQHRNPGTPLETDPFSVLEELKVNAVAPYALTKYIVPSLRKRDTKKVIFVSTAMGSLHLSTDFMDKSLRGLNPPVYENFFTMGTYGASKSALNMFVTGWNGTLYPEGFTTIAIHPGWVQTDLTGGPGRAHLTTEESVTSMLKTVGEAKPESKLVLKNLDGTTIPW